MEQKLKKNLLYKAQSFKILVLSINVNWDM